MLERTRPGALPPKQDIIRAVTDQRRRTLSFVAGLDAAQFETEVLPNWRVREVLAHLITTDRSAVTGSILTTVFGSMERLEAWNERQVPRYANRHPADLLVALDRWGRRFARFARAIPGPMYRVRMPTIWGRGSGGMLVFGRAYDEWVHRQDMRRAFGQPDEDVDLAPIVEFLFAATRTHVLPQLRHAEGRIGVSLSGLPLPEWRFDLSAGTAGPADDDQADARVMASGPDFVMTAAGRGSFADLEQRGRLTIEGDAGLARSFLEPLRIV